MLKIKTISKEIEICVVPQSVRVTVFNNNSSVVGISPTLVVGGELNQHKSRGESLTSWASFWGVTGFPPGVRPVGLTLLVLGRQLVSGLGPQSLVPVHTWVV